MKGNGKAYWLTTNGKKANQKYVCHPALIVTQSRDLLESPLLLSMIQEESALDWDYLQYSAARRGQEIATGTTLTFDISWYIVNKNSIECFKDLPWFLWLPYANNLSEIPFKCPHHVLVKIKTSACRAMSLLEKRGGKKACQELVPYTAANFEMV